MFCGLLLSCWLVVALAVSLHSRLLLFGIVIRQHWFGPVSNRPLLPCRIGVAIWCRAVRTWLLLSYWRILGAASHVSCRFILCAWPDILATANLQGWVLLQRSRVERVRKWVVYSGCMVSGRLNVG